MKRVLTRVFPMLCTALVMLAATVQAVAQPAMKPVVVASLSGYDELIKDVAFLGKMAEMPDLAQSVEGLIGLFTQFQGLNGLDKTKPIGVALNSDGAQFQVIGFVPVKELDKLLAALVGAVGEAKDAGDGCKSITVKNIPVLVKEQNGWAFIGMSKDAFASLPKNPAELLGDLPEDYDVGISVHVQNVPAAFREIGVQQLKMGMQQGMQRMPNESDEQFDARRKMVEQQLSGLTDALNELDTLTMGFAIDSVERGAYFDVGVSVLPNGKLAKQLAAIATAKSKHTGFLLDDSILTMHLASVMTEADMAQSLAALDTVRQQALAEVKKKASGPADEQQKVEGWVNGAFDVLVDTIKGGSVSGGAVLTGEGPLTLASGVTVVGGDKLEKMLKEILDHAKTKSDFSQAQVTIKYDAGKHKGVRFHTVSMPIPNKGDAEKAKEFLGDEIVLTFGFSKESVFFAVGEDGIETLTDVIDASAEGDDEVLPFELSLALGPIMKMAAKADPNNAEVGIMAAALKDGDDLISLTTEIEGLTQTARFDIEEGVLRAFGMAVKSAAAKKQK